MKEIRIAVVMVLLVLLVSFSVVGCKPQQIGPATKVPIKIGYVDSFSGPAAGTVLPMSEGVKARVQYLNDKEGGINGHPLELVMIDCKWDAALAADAWKRLSTLEKVPLIYGAVPIAFGPLYPEAAKKDKIVYVAISSNLEHMVTRIGHEGESWVFGLGALYTDRMIAMLYYALDQWTEMGEPFPMQVAYVGVDTKDSRSGGKAVKLACQRDPQHLKFTTEVYHKSNITDANTEVLTLKAANPDCLIAYELSQTWIPILKDAQRLGFAPTLKGGHPAIQAPDVTKAVGTLNEGVFAYSEFVLWDDTDVPALKPMHETFSQMYPNKETGFSESLWCWGSTSLCIEALKRAVEDVGYENLSGEAVRKALEKGGPILTGVMGKDGQTALKYSTSWHAGPKTIGANVIRGDKIFIDGWYTVPDLTPEELDPEYWRK